MSGELVLVTGGSGFIGAHCILKLLDAGYRVRTTVRSLKREPDVRAMLKVGGVEPGDTLSFAAADLTSDEGWPEAVDGCTYVLHVASPFPSVSPKNEDELIIPAREGALRALRAAQNAGVKRVVLTSSFAAIGYGHKSSDQPFTEETWTDLTGPGVSAYAKSKTLAERAAWDFIKNEGGTMELSVVNPVGVFGPVLGPDYSSSIHVMQQLLSGEMARLPSLSFGIVDVRDVADLHLLAMTHSAAKGERFLSTAGIMSIMEGAQTLKAHMGEAGSRISTKPLPDWLVRIAAPFSPAAAQIVHDLGKKRSASSEKAKRLLGWTPRSKEDAIIATAQSLVQLGLLQTS